MSRPQMIWIEDTDPEWERMWQALDAEVGNVSELDPTTLEGWQYMGTTIDKDGGLHEFRHRSLNGERIYARIPASREVRA